MNKNDLLYKKSLHVVFVSISSAGFWGFGGSQFDHELDSDDIVPEFSEAVKIQVEKKAEKEIKTDFNGEHFEEFYDE